MNRRWQASCGRRLAVLAIGWAIGMTGSPSSARAAWPGSAAEYVRLTLGAPDAFTVKTCTDARGGALVFWQLGTGQIGIRAQHVFSDGTLAWGPTGLVVAEDNADARLQAIVADAHGGAFVAWKNGSLKNRVQHVDSTGTLLWPAEGRRTCTPELGDEIALLASDDGGLFMAWRDARGIPPDLYHQQLDIYAQRLDASGLPLWDPAGVAVCDEVHAQHDPVIVSDGLGGAIVAWKDARVASLYPGNALPPLGVYAQRMNESGARLWQSDGVPLHTENVTAIDLTASPDGSGGVTLAWMSWRNVPPVTRTIWAQHVSLSGEPAWTEQGIQISPAPPLTGDSRPRLARAPNGDVIVCWRHVTTSTAGVEAQRIDPAGNLLWGSDPVSVTPLTGQHDYPDLTSDGADGVWIAWHDRRSSYWDIYAQHLDGGGQPTFEADGIPVSVLPDDSQLPTPCPDGNGGVVIAWHVNDGALPYSWHPAAARVNRAGMLAGEEPVHVSVADVPNDQGGRVSVRWGASFLDFAPSGEIADYEVLLRPAGEIAWSSHGPVSAAGVPEYEFIAPAPTITPTDTSQAEYRVVARHRDGLRSWPSLVRRGRSSDELAPGVPVLDSIGVAGGHIFMRWRTNPDGDIQAYRVYRSLDQLFVPQPSGRIAELADTTITVLQDSAWVYRVTALDLHGNEGPGSLAVVTGLASVDPATRRGVRFAPVHPSPSARECRFEFVLPRASRVRLEVLDALGRRVAVLCDASFPAGEHFVTWDPQHATSPTPSGVLWARLRTEDGIRIRRFVVLR